jgi:alpha-L-rhamnosidase
MKSMLKSILFSILLTGVSFMITAQLPPVFGPEYTSKVQKSNLVKQYITPVKIVWQSDNSNTFMLNSDNLLKSGDGQADLNSGNYFTMKSDNHTLPGIVLDFGKELQGGVRLITTIDDCNRHVKVRIRLGESVSEAMSDIGEKDATNDHAMRDFIVELPWLGKLEIGNSGFRFVRIDLIDWNTRLVLKEVSAAFVYRDIPYLGSFKCNDDRLNQIWLTGAYTVQLNMQDYLWDGVKRDRLVWVGDMNPEIMSINTVFGYNEVVPKSLDLARESTPLPGWMNGISSYSMWWIINHHNWYMYQGNLTYLREQKDYLIRLLDQLIEKTDASGMEKLDGGRFLDWPSSENPEAVHAGLQSLMVMTMKAGADLCLVLGEAAEKTKCLQALELLRKHVPAAGNSKQAAALLALADLMPADKADREVLAVDGARRMSTFYGYYMLQAMAKAGNYGGALDDIRTYWGAMLDLGATTFWEDFNMDWTVNASRIDEVVPAGKVDVHGDYGAYCYLGYRHSFCHGWASGPTSWLTENVLGITVAEPGCRTLKIVPHLAGLQWAEGTFPTPFGIVKVRHDRMPDGTIRSKIDAPKGVKIIR